MPDKSVGLLRFTPKKCLRQCRCIAKKITFRKLCFGRAPAHKHPPAPWGAMQIRPCAGSGVPLLCPVEFTLRYSAGHTASPPHAAPQRLRPSPSFAPNHTWYTSI